MGAMETFLSQLLPAFQSIGIVGYWVVFLVSFLESLAFVGALVPGASLVILAGFLSSQGFVDLDIGDLIWFASLGAIAGDSLSFYFGSRGTYLFKKENRFFKLSHIEEGGKFFEKHGGKSILMGRFIGPIRPIIPFVAGLSNMNKKSFLAWNIASGFLWGASYLLAGYFFGAAFEGLIPADMLDGLTKF